MDVIDQASDREMADRERAIAARRFVQPTGPSCSHCLDCGEPIPLERQRAIPGVKRCVDCQTLHEESTRHDRTS